MARALRAFVLPFKIAVLAFVLVRFHGSFVGLAVVLGMAALWFGLDRSLRRWLDARLGTAARKANV